MERRGFVKGGKVSRYGLVSSEGSRLKLDCLSTITASMQSQFYLVPVVAPKGIQCVDTVISKLMHL